MPGEVHPNAKYIYPEMRIYGFDHVQCILTNKYRNKFVSKSFKSDSILTNVLPACGQMNDEKIARLRPNHSTMTPAATTMYFLLRVIGPARSRAARQLYEGCCRVTCVAYRS